MAGVADATAPPASPGVRLAEARALISAGLAGDGARLRLGLQAAAGLLAESAGAAAAAAALTLALGLKAVGRLAEARAATHSGLRAIAEPLDRQPRSQGGSRDPVASVDPAEQARAAGLPSRAATGAALLLEAARLSVDLGDAAAASALLDQAAQLAPGLLAPAQEVLLVLCELDLGRLLQQPPSPAVLARGRALLSGCASALERVALRGELASREADPAAALAALEEAEAQASALGWPRGRAQLRLRRAQVLARGGRFDAAELAISQALGDDPTQAGAAHERLAELWEGRGDLQRMLHHALAAEEAAARHLDLLPAGRAALLATRALRRLGSSALALRHALQAGLCFRAAGLKQPLAELLAEEAACRAAGGGDPPSG